MTKRAVIDELHLTIRIPNDLPENQTQEIRRTLNQNNFMSRLRRALRFIVKAYPELTGVSLSVSR
jgi:hypothetical protein